MQGRVPLLVVLACGLLAGDMTGGVETAPFVALAALGGALLLLLVPGAPPRRLIAATVLAAFGFGCAAAARVYAPDFPPDHVARLRLPLTARVVGRVIAAPERRTTERLRLAVEEVVVGKSRLSAGGVILIYVRATARRWQAGDRVSALLSMRRPRNFGNPGEMDYAGYLARRGIYVTAFAADDSSFELLGHSEPPLTAVIDRWREGLRRLFSETLGEETARVLCALIVGDAAGLPRDVQEAFQRSGVRHVLTISGLHIGMVAASGYAAARWLLARSTRLLLAGNVPKLALAMSTVPVMLYAALAGGSVPTVRAVVMALVFLGAAVVDRRRHLLASLALAAAVLVASGPGTSQEISFQLSFAAVAGLVLALDRFWPWYRAWEERRLIRLRGGGATYWRAVALYAAVSAAAIAATLPLTAYHFNQVSLMALVANAVVVPLLGTAAVASGLLAAVAYLASPALAVPLVWVAGAAVYVGVQAVHVLAAVPYAQLRVVTPTLLELALVYGALLAWLCLRGRRRAAALVVVAVVGFADAAWWWVERRHPGELRVTFLSVGQGDASVVEFPGGEVMIVDAGGLGSGTFDVGERLVAPFLWSRRIATVDWLVLTHPHYDHYGGLRYLVEHFAPREIWTTGAVAPAAAYAALLSAVERNGVRERHVRSGQRLHVGGAEVQVKYPPEEVTGLSVNDRSLVLSVAHGGSRVLLTGDIEARAEARLLQSATGLRSAVVKVPHHGSVFSSTPAFVSAVQPGLAVVSAGFANRYGFPSGRVLGRYAAGGAQILRTDLDGAVEVRIDSAGTMRARVWATGQRKSLD